MALLLEQLKHAHARAHGYCAVCGESKALLHCGACLTGVYCGAACQARDWRAGHQAFCLVAGNGKRKAGELQKWAARARKTPRTEYTLGTLPKEIVDVLAGFLENPEDVRNMRLINRWFASNPLLVRRLQRDYTYEIRDLQDLERARATPWTRGIWRIVYLGNDEEVVRQLALYFTELRELYLGWYDRDIAPLANLVHLTTLILTSYRGDIAPLVNLTSLTSLDLESYRGDIAPLAKLVNLTVLYLNSYRGDIAPLANLVNLTVLNLNSYRGDIAPLAGLVHLTKLGLHSYEGDIAPLVNLVHLNSLILPYRHPHRDDWRVYLERVRAGLE